MRPISAKPFVGQMKSVANLDQDIRSGGAFVADSNYEFPSL